MGTVDSILKGFTRTINKLEKLALSANKEGERYSDLALKTENLAKGSFAESKRASIVAGKLNKLLSDEE